MASGEYNWLLIRKIADEFWEDELSYLNEQQINAIQKSLEDGSALQDNYVHFDNGFECDLLPVIEYVAAILQIIAITIELVKYAQGAKKHEEIIKEVKIIVKEGKNKQMTIVIKEISSEKFSNIINSILDLNNDGHARELKR